jgi:transposase InsO family protein
LKQLDKFLRIFAEKIFRASWQWGNLKHIRRLMGLMGIEAIYPKPNLSKSAQGYKIYPYLLRGCLVTALNQVWATDITYIPMAKGFLYLTAVIDRVFPLCAVLAFVQQPALGLLCGLPQRRTQPMGQTTDVMLLFGKRQGLFFHRLFQS